MQYLSRIILCIILVFCSILFSANGQEINEQEAVEINAPPMGFNSFDSYIIFLGEKKAEALIDTMAKKYKPFGYTFFVIDAGWYDEVELFDGTTYPKKRLGLELDEYGLPEPSNAYFPNGLNALSKRAHEQGLKFGVWIIRGIPRKAVELNLPIKGTNYRARDIADINNICVWDSKNYGVDMSKPGAQEYYNSLIDKLASFGVDFIKVDDMVPYPDEIVAIDKAIKNGNHKIVYSLSPGDVHSKSYLPYYRKSHMLRITSDVWDNQASIDKSFKAWGDFVGLETTNFYPDLDMIPFGRLRVEIPDWLESEKEKSRQSLFNKAQMRTFITQRALAASPLFIGGDLLTMDDYSYALLTNKNMLACNQNGVMGEKVFDKKNIEVWMTRDKNNSKKGWIGIFNRSNKTESAVFSKRDLGFTKFIRSYEIMESNKSFKLKDIWNEQELLMNEVHKVKIGANDVLFYEFEEQYK